MALCLLACSGRPISAAQMAPGLKGFNIDHGPPRSGPIGGSVAIEPQVDARRPLLFEPSRASESSSDGGRSWPSARLGKYSAALNIFASLAIFGVMALYLVDDPRQFRDFTTMVPSSAEAIGEKGTGFSSPGGRASAGMCRGDIDSSEYLSSILSDPNRREDIRMHCYSARLCTFYGV